MPYDWIAKDTEHDTAELHLWPHQSLPPRGFAAVVLMTFTLILVPLVPFLGTVVLWGILPFMLVALGGIWLALRRNWRDQRILEVLTLTDDTARLVRRNPRGDVQNWECNRYWAQAEMHARGGPVPHYITLRGGGREVEIGAFLSEDERKALYDELQAALSPAVLRR
ncbi:MAG TPA: DUF2244 domain-containing protein [Rhodobacteraceae bacterium]|nr:DUF2244 domain-containing protein [Paracoccaceae bacterium]